MSETLINVKHLYKVFGKNPETILPLIEQGESKDNILADTGHTVGLKDINLEIKRGEIFVIMGLSGSGKSTLIRHFNRLIDPTAGEIIVEGADVMKFSDDELQEFRRHKMSMVFQRFGLMPHISVIENVAYGLNVQQVNKEKRLAEARKWLNDVGLKGYEEQYPSQLSGGQQQRVGLARALCTNAEILLMDEAFSALDPLIRSEMQDQLIELQQTLHKTIIFITHDLDEALRLGDRIAILKDGEIVQQGTQEDILLNPADDYVEAFVKDVNRARALTVKAVMEPAARRISATTIADALEQMRKSRNDYAYIVNDQSYHGFVTRKGLEKAYDQGADQPFNNALFEDMTPIDTHALLDTVIPEILDSDYPLPVVDKDGHLQGELSRSCLAAVLATEAVKKTNKEQVTLS